MADIFISYSSKDREKASQLYEILSSAGLSVWIDHAGIGAATSWSEEIYDAIESCKALVVMLSHSSIVSKNVAREVSLAFEKNKKILPLDLEPVELTRELGYHLAGMQRTSISNIDSVIRALSGVGLEATHAPQPPKIVHSSDQRKSLMILPFEDLSPTQDNSWFTDGIASEMIATLSHIKMLKIIDWNTSRMLKLKSISTVDLAREFSVRYFIEGQVRKFGNQIKISITLLDIETGDHLWQDNIKGTMDDIFEIQERCAANVITGLELHLTNEEQDRITKRRTESPEAYELFLKATEYYIRNTESDYRIALSMYKQAVLIDPDFTEAYANIALSNLQLYTAYARNKTYIDEAEEAASRILQHERETPTYCYIMSAIARFRGDHEQSLHLAKRAVELDPDEALSHAALGLAYRTLGRHEDALGPLEEFVRLRENITNARFNLLHSMNELGDLPQMRDRLRHTAERAIPLYERHIRLNPDDYAARVELANVFRWAEKKSDALKEANAIAELLDIDSAALYNLACLYSILHEPDKGIVLLRRSLEQGFKQHESILHDPDLDELRSLPEFDTLVGKLLLENG